MSKYQRLISLAVLLIVWQTASFVISNAIILPSFLEVLKYLAVLLKTASFYQAFLMTFVRAHLAFLISSFLGMSLAYLSFRYHLIEVVILPWIKMLQSIPQISFVILLLFWFSSETSILWVGGLMVFPIAYFNEWESLKAIEKDYLDIIVMSHQPWWYNLKKAYLPLSRSGWQATIKSGLPLSLKVTVMSEVLIHTRIGIGRSLTIARANIDMVGVFAWTLAMIVLISLETALLTKWLDKHNR